MSLANVASSDHEEPVTYRSRPVSDFIREVLLGTPQGLACVFSCVLWLGAGVVWLFLTPEQRSIPMLAMAEGFFFFPILLLLVFVWGNAGSRVSKVEPSRLLALVYIGAGLYPFIHAYLPSDIDVAGFVLAIVLALGIGLPARTVGIGALTTGAIGIVFLAASMLIGAFNGFTADQLLGALRFVKIASDNHSHVGALVMLGYAFLGGALLSTAVALIQRSKSA